MAGNCFKTLILFVLVFCTSLTAFAQEGVFDTKAANASLEQITKTLSKNNVGLRYLENSVKQLSRLNDQAQSCEKEKRAELKRINDQLKISNKEIEVKKTTEEESYLKKRVDVLSDELSQCRLFALKSDETIDQLQKRIQDLAKLTLIQSKSPSYALLTSIKLDEVKQLSENAVQLLQTFGSTLILFALLPILWIKREKVAWCRKHQPATKFILALFALLAVSGISMSWFGFHSLVWYLVRGLLLAIIYSVAAYYIFHATNIIFDVIKSGDHKYIASLYRLLGVRKGKLVPEVLLLQLAIILTVLTVYVMFMVDAWEYSGTYLQKAYVLVNEGIQIGTVTLIPINILLGILMLSFVGLVTRYLRQWIYRNVHLSRDASVRVAAASLLGYVGFGLAVLIGLLVAGVNLTGLAIVAGALSVGAGFGLQGVVNNFVSGLILLIEQPIKPGDRIVVGETEGHVKKIRMRSTQITTMQKTDVIVPNSDLISNQVTNLMFRDQNWRIETTIGVAYGSDVQLVQRLLVEIAKRHPDVVKDDKLPPPRALLLNFGDSSIDFELRCIVKDVDLRNRVLSDLHMEIDRVFKENNIVIPFPQRDVHIIHEKGE